MKSLILEAVFTLAAASFNFGFTRRALPWTALTLWTTLSLSTDAANAAHLFEWLPGVSWVRAAGFCFFLTAPLLLLSLHFWKRSAERVVTSRARRNFLRTSVALAATPAAGLALGFSIARREAEVTEVNLRFPKLPRDLEGLRIVQLSDIHLSPFFSRDQLRRVVDQANELRPTLAVVTGDLITSFGDPLDDALAELARLRAVAGIHGCLGNHEILAEAEEHATRQGARHGIHFLRSQHTSLRFGGAKLNLAGVDYQRKGKVYLPGADKMIRPEEFNLLLSHNPDVFPVAAAQGWDLTLAGHTHGGQITLEFLHPSLNPARFYTPFTAGEYEQDGRRIFVTRGVGTVGVPLRLSAGPEIVLARLTRL